MERLTGVVMEIIGRRVVVITQKGEFKQVRIHGRTPDIGEEISIPVGHRRFFNKPIATWAAVAAAVIFLVVGGPLLSMMNLSSGPQLSEEDIIVKPFSEVISKAGGEFDQIIGKAHKEQQVENKEKQDQLAATGQTGTGEAVISAGAGPDQPSQPVDTGEPAADIGKERYIEPIRREGDPEVRSKPSDTKDNQAAVAQQPSGQPIENPAGEPTEDPAGGVADPDTDENYMGPETGSGSENNDMYILRPNF